ncbi:MAG: nucleoside hydrolase [Actinomycetota bacterium]|nr:nucleoside hydrolase [Actinomycetota bacterium]
MHRLLVTLLLVAAACSSPETSPTATTTTAPTSPIPPELETPAPERTPVIVDYSPTVSDVAALLYLLTHPGVDVLAITVPVTGEAGCDLGFEVTLGILAMLDRKDVPVACDPEVPPAAEAWPEEFLTGHESLTSGLPRAGGPGADPRPAHELIAEVATASDRPVTLIAVAPLTNVARTLDLHPDVADQIDRIVIMGGAVDSPGNVGSADAEWNFWIDVPAAARVLASGVPITLVPLDATNDVPVPGSWQRDLQAAEQSEPVEYLGALVQIFPAVTSGFFYLWDELAASAAAGEDLVTTQNMNLTVVEEPGPEYGGTVRDPSGATVTVATGVPDPNEFYARFLGTLAGAPIETREPPLVDDVSAPDSVGSTSTPEEVLAFWLIRALAGDVEAAASVVAADAPWVGLGSSSDVFVEGSGPYEAFDFALACTSDGALTSCDLEWSDLWIAANPDLERGELRVSAEVVNGTILAFQEFVFTTEMPEAFERHLAWLQTEHPERVEEACAAETGSKPCSELLVATVEEWVESR